MGQEDRNIDRKRSKHVEFRIRTGTLKEHVHICCTHLEDDVYVYLVFL